MSFFEPPARPPAYAPRAVATSPPAWIGPPRNVLPGIAPVQLIVARTDETVVAIAGIQAYPAGFCFTLSLRLRNLSVREERRSPYPFDSTDLEDDPLADDFLRFGVQFADGRKATTLEDPPYDPEGKGPDRPVLRQHGGGGGGAAWDMEHWLWPLPPAGPFAFVCEWPGRGIAESRAEIDAALILEAAGHAMTLWPVETLWSDE
jgi:hypothetical protein